MRALPALAALAALIALSGLAPGSTDAVAQQARPNFIIVMADDQGPGMMRALPQTRRLIGKRGTVFTDALASYPLCCPARATVLTGQYAHNHGAQGNNARSGGGYRALIEPQRNLAAWLQASGYVTAFAGKWLNGLRTPRRAPPGWTNWWGLVGAGGEGLSSYYDYEIFEPGAKPRHFGTGVADYQTDALTREYALPFISTQAASPQPFFLWLAYHPPHSGLGRRDAAGRRCTDGPPGRREGKQSAIPPARYARSFAAASPPRRPSFDERDMSDKPAFLRRKPPLSDRDLDRVERDYRCGLAALLALDDAIADIVANLRATGQLERTVIVFTADHGVLAGEHRIARAKNRPYEEAISIPLLIRGPGFAAGSEISSPVANADLAPTFLELAGATAPPELARPLDGVSLSAAIAAGSGSARRVIPIEGRGKAVAVRNGFKVRSYVGVRTSRYAYTEYRRASYETLAEASAAPIGAGRATDTELYDLRRDPYELRSRHGDPSYARARRALARLTTRLERCAGTRCVVRAGVPRGRQKTPRCGPQGLGLGADRGLDVRHRRCAALFDRERRLGPARQGSVAPDGPRSRRARPDSRG